MKTVVKRINPAFKQTQPLPLLTTAMLEQLARRAAGNQFLPESGMVATAGLNRDCYGKTMAAVFNPIAQSATV